MYKGGNSLFQLYLGMQSPGVEFKTILLLNGDKKVSQMPETAIFN